MEAWFGLSRLRHIVICTLLQKKKKGFTRDEFGKTFCGRPVLVLQEYFGIFGRIFPFINFGKDKNVVDSFLPKEYLKF